MTLVIFSYPSSGDHFHKAEDELAIIQILCHITRQLKQLGQMVAQVDGDSRISL